MKALSERPVIDFSKVKLTSLMIGGQEIFGGCVTMVAPPSKGQPYWEIRYDVGIGPQVLYAASTPIMIEAVEIKQEHVEEVVDDDE
jgi:hypothetical protein